MASLASLRTLWWTSLARGLMSTDHGLRGIPVVQCHGHAMSCICKPENSWSVCFPLAFSSLCGSPEKETWGNSDSQDRAPHRPPGLSESTKTGLAPQKANIACSKDPIETKRQNKSRTARPKPQSAEGNRGPKKKARTN